MKKIIALLIAAALTLLVACGTAPAAPATFKIASLKGPTTMGMVELMNKSENGEYENTYDVTVYGTADEFVAAFSKGDINVANIPSNLASVLYYKTNGNIKIAAVNTLGVLYVISTGNVKTVADLKGKTLYTTGKGTTPEYVLNHVLTVNGIDPEKDVKIEYLSEATEVASKLSDASSDTVALLPQPYVTVVTSQNKSYQISLDMNKEWEKVSGGTPIVTGVVAVNKAFYENNKGAFEQFLADYADSVKYVNENNADAAALIEKYGIIKAAVAEKALPYCNITLLTGDEMHSAVLAYLDVLYGANPASVGGKMPDEEIFVK